MTALTPCERAWADLCDEKPNPDVERIVAATGGWEAWLFAVSYTPFVAAFNGDYTPLLRERREREEAYEAEIAALEIAD